MLCYAMLCYAMLCYDMLYYTILYYAILYYAILCYAMLCGAMLDACMAHACHRSHSLSRFILHSFGLKTEASSFSNNSMAECLFQPNRLRKIQHTIPDTVRTFTGINRSHCPKKIFSTFTKLIFHQISLDSPPYSTLSLTFLRPHRQE